MGEEVEIKIIEKYQVDDINFEELQINILGMSKYEKMKEFLIKIKYDKINKKSLKKYPITTKIMKKLIEDMSDSTKEKYSKLFQN